MSLPQACECADILDITLDELAGREVPKSYADPRQAKLNGCYESLNDESKDTIVEVVASFASDASRRVEKNVAEGVDDPLALGNVS